MPRLARSAGTSCRTWSCRPIDGPLTVMVLAHVTAEGAGKFSEGEYHGVVLPAGAGSIAVVAREGQEFDG